MSAMVNQLKVHYVDLNVKLANLGICWNYVTSDTLKTLNNVLSVKSKRDDYVRSLNEWQRSVNDRKYNYTGVSF